MLYGIVEKAIGTRFSDSVCEINCVKDFLIGQCATKCRSCEYICGEFSLWRIFLVANCPCGEFSLWRIFLVAKWSLQLYPPCSWSYLART